MAKIDTLFMIKAAEKPYPLPPPGGGGGGTWVQFCWVCAAGLS